MKYKYVFWDWNGTLLDDVNAALNAVNLMLDNRNLPNITLEEYRDMIQVPIIKFYEKIMDVSKEAMDSLSVEYDSLWKSNLPEKPLFSGVEEALKSFNDLGLKQYIFSSSRNELIEPILQKQGISKYFIRVLGAPDRYVGSKAERTRDFLIENNILPGESLFVGDMLHDSEVADFIGADCILLKTGHQGERALKESGRAVLSSLEELSSKFKSN